MIRGRVSDTYQRRLTIIFGHICCRLTLDSHSAAGSSEILGSDWMINYDLGSLRGTIGSVLTVGRGPIKSGLEVPFQASHYLILTR